MDESKVKSDRGLQVAEGQRAVVGQELDSLEGDFSASQYFDGKIADLRFYDRTLTLQAMIAFTTCSDDFKDESEPLLTISNGKLKTVGSVNVTRILKSKLCEKMTEYLILFPIQTSFRNSVDTCSRLKGSLALPKNRETNRELYDRFTKFRAQCNSETSNSLRFWIGAKLNTSLRRWEQLSDGKPLSWHNFGTVSFDQWMKCVVIGHRKANYLWHNNGCEEYLQECFACNFTAWPQIRIRGLCKHSLFDRSLYLNNYDNNVPKFDGEQHSHITLRKGKWVMKSSIYTDLEATMLSLTDDVIPLGRHKWNVSGDRCNGTTVS